jgi:NADH-quinone oxidoreductase subunit A
MIEQYVPIFVMIVGGAIFGLVMVKLNEWLGPKRPTQQKVTTYESGMEPVRTARERFTVKFYLVALLFIVFDIEVVFLYPWAVMFKSLDLAAHLVMLFFLVVLILGLVYEWRKGALEWD